MCWPKPPDDVGNPYNIQGQDLHISCPADQVELLVAEFERQFLHVKTVSVYDYGVSSKYQTGYVVLTWDAGVDLDFLVKLDADPRLEGYSLYNLPFAETGYLFQTPAEVPGNGETVEEGFACGRDAFYDCFDEWDGVEIDAEGVEERLAEDIIDEYRVLITGESKILPYVMEQSNPRFVVGFTAGFVQMYLKERQSSQARG